MDRSNNKQLTPIKNILSVFSITILLGLSACSSVEDENDIDYVAELTEIETKFEATVLWDESVGNGVSDYFSRIKPIIAYDAIYSASREGIAAAYEISSGKVIWETDLRDLNGEVGFFESKESAKLSGGPTAGLDKIFYGSEQGKIFALDATSGKLVWQADIKGEVIAAPAIESEILVVNSVSGILKALNANTGEELWKIEQDVPPLTLRGISTPVISSGGVIVGTAAGTLNVYLLDTGRSGWSAQIGEATGSTELERVIDLDSKPVVFGDKVYTVSSRGNLAAVELRTGRISWKRQYSSYRQIAISGNNIYLTDVKGHIYAIDRINGLEKWSQNSLTNRGVTGPVVFGDYIVVGDNEGYLHWLDSATGEFVARHEVDSSGIYSTPIVVDNILYAQSRDGDLQAIKTP